MNAMHIAGTIIYIFIFIVVYILLILELDKKWRLSLAGALSAIFVAHVFGLFPAEKMGEFLGHNLATILTLFGLMAFSQLLRVSGVLQFVSIKMVKSQLGKYNPRRLFLLMGMLAFFSTLALTNLVSVYIILSMVILLIGPLGLELLPWAMVITHIVSVGGCSSLLGSVPAILTGEAAGISFVEFLIYNIVPGLLSSYVFILYIYYLSHEQIPSTLPVRKEILEEIDPWMLVPEKRYFWISAASILAIIIILVLQPVFQLTLEYVLLAIVVILTYYAPVSFEEIWASIDYDLLIFICGIFILVGGLEEIGIIPLFAKGLAYISGDPKIAIWIFGLLVFVLSMVIENNALTVMMLPVAPVIAEILNYNKLPFYFALLWGVQTGGTAFILGDPANFVTLSLLEHEGIKVTSKEFIKFSMLPAVISMIIALTWISLIF